MGTGGLRMKKIDAKILLIDDNPKNLQIAMNILNKDGYNLIYAKDGTKGVELALASNFDLILLDVVMPDMNSYEVCQKLKKNKKTKNIPIIFLTVKDEEEDIIKGFRCGGVDYVTKPFCTDVLLQRVKTHIKLSQTAKELKYLNETLEERVKQQIEKIRFNDQILFQQAKMASMGEMIANIAHQWRQPLSAISTISLGIKTKFALNKFGFNNSTDTIECEAYINTKLNDIECYILSLSHTIDDFRNFFNPQKETNTFNVTDIIEKSVRLLNASLKNSDIQIINNLENIKMIGLENELSQVLINLLNNARDALIKQNQDQKIIFRRQFKK